MNESMYKAYEAVKAVNKDAPDWTTFHDRFRNLYGMNEIIKSLNDETAYTAWIYTVPDEASLDDLADICCDPDLYSDCVRKFARLFIRFAKDGIYIGHELYMF